MYAVGHPLLSVRGRWLAAVLSCGPGAALCRRSAGALWDLRWYSGPHEVATLGRRRRPGVRPCEFALWPDEVTVEDGIPVTTVARTILDLAGILDPDRLAQAVGEAERRRLADSPSLPELVERHRGARGLATLRTILADRRVGIDVPASDLEVEFAAFIRKRNLPRPELNAWLEVGAQRFKIDCLWRERGFAVELDSREWHDNDDSFETDRARDLALLSIGIRTGRVTARRLRSNPDGLERELLAALVTGPGAL